jgi:DNA-binding NarL/FixJ family response regulator
MSSKHPGAIRVLIVDEHRCVLWALERLVNSAMPAMAVVGGATDRLEAFALIGKTEPNVILLGIDLAGTGALETISLFKARSSARVLVMTPLQDKAVHARAVLAGACGVIDIAASPELIVTAIVKVDQGQIWLDRLTLGRMLGEFLSRYPAAQSDPDRHKLALLSAREREIVEVMSGNAGLPAGGVAAKLHISEHTLRNHLTAIYGKLGVGNRLALFAYAQSHGLDKHGLDKLG